MQSVTIPDTVTEIGKSAFENCEALEKINIPDSVTKIGDKAFANCKSLNSITLPNSIIEIGKGVFDDCVQLQTFTLPRRFTIFKDYLNRHYLPTKKVGDYRKFGNYPQTADGQEQPIEWKVLSIENNKMLVISCYGLDSKRFDVSSNNWKDSEIRQWLNNEFYNKAFDENDKKYINSVDGDNVFLLTKEDAEKYFADENARKCKATEYAVKNGVWVADNSYESNADYSYWWLCSPNLYRNNYVYSITYSGIIVDYSTVEQYDIVVRPALWINI